MSVEGVVVKMPAHQQKCEDSGLALPDLSLDHVVWAHLYDRLGTVSSAIQVELDPKVDGLVILTGNVPTYYVKQMAWKIAEKTAGVRSVIDRLQVVEKTSGRISR